MTKQIRVLLMVMFTLIIGTGTVSAYSSKTMSIRVIDLNYDELHEVSVGSTVQNVLDEIGITVKDEDTISKNLNENLANSDTVEIRRAIPVLIKVDDVPRLVYTSKTNVGDVIKESLQDLGNRYKLDGVTEKTRVSSNMTIKIITQKDVIITEIIDIPFETKRIENSDLFVGIEHVTQAGSNGTKQVTLKNMYEGTEIVASNEVGTVILKQAIPKMIEVGTKEIPTIDGYAYIEAVTVTATGYTPFDPGCNNTTALGTPAVRGVVAIDPTVFKYGTKFYIPGYGIGVAEDCGGAIKGYKIDLCYATQEEAFAWGRRTLTVYIIE